VRNFVVYCGGVWQFFVDSNLEIAQDASPLTMSHHHQQPHASSIALDPKMAAEHLGGFVSNSQAYNMDALGFQHLQPTKLAPGIVKKKNRTKDTEHETNEPVRQAPVRKYQAPAPAAQVPEVYEDDGDEGEDDEGYYDEGGDGDEEDEEEDGGYEEYDDEPLEDQSKASSVASLENKYSSRAYNTHEPTPPPHLNNENQSRSSSSSAAASAASLESKYSSRSYGNQDYSAPPASTIAPERSHTTTATAAPVTATPVVANVSAPFPRYTPRVRTNNYQDQYASSGPAPTSAPASVSSNSPVATAVISPSSHTSQPQALSGGVAGAPYPKWTPPSSLKSFQDSTAPAVAPPTSLPSYGQTHGAPTQDAPLPNGHSRYQSAPAQAPIAAAAVALAAAASVDDQQSFQLPPHTQNRNQSTTGVSVPVQSSPVSQAPAPGQAGYKWTPPALLKQFQDTNQADELGAPIESVAPAPIAQIKVASPPSQFQGLSVQQSPVEQPQVQQPLPVIAAPLAKITKPGLSSIYRIAF
jgi:hypothetical protein